MSEAKLITISMDEYKRLDALRARVSELEVDNEKLVKSINRAGGLTFQGASHELIREILREALEGHDDIPCGE